MLATIILPHQITSTTWETWNIPFGIIAMWAIGILAFFLLITPTTREQINCTRKFILSDNGGNAPRPFAAAIVIWAVGSALLTSICSPVLVIGPAIMYVSMGAPLSATVALYSLIVSCFALAAMQLSPALRRHAT